MSDDDDFASAYRCARAAHRYLVQAHDRQAAAEPAMTSTAGQLSDADREFIDAAREKFAGLLFVLSGLPVPESIAGLDTNGLEAACAEVRRLHQEVDGLKAVIEVQNGLNTIIERQDRVSAESAEIARLRKEVSSLNKIIEMRDQALPEDSAMDTVHLSEHPAVIEAKRIEGIVERARVTGQIRKGTADRLVQKCWEVRIHLSTEYDRSAGRLAEIRALARNAGVEV